MNQALIDEFENAILIGHDCHGSSEEAIQIVLKAAAKTILEQRTTFTNQHIGANREAAAAVLALGDLRLEDL